MLKIIIDPQANAIYIYVSDLPVAFTKELDEDRLIDYASDGTPVGIDLLNVSDGIETSDLPNRAQVEQLLAL